LGFLPVELEAFSDFDSVLADDEVVRQNDLEEQAREEGGGTEEETEQMFLEAEFDGLEGLVTILNQCELDDDGADKDGQEQLVVEEVLEDVVFVSLQFAGVDFIEDLQQHEYVEEDRVMLAGLIIPVTDTDR
jgi:hypothetical protein